MVESRMAESDITAMKETLRAQQQLLQKLYAELDQEREASATAASEAMDMILRLQGEKAAVKMEASHYKRMAEEKIGHAEATLEVFEELMYQKEMEIASLEFQVLAYKNKLLTLGFDFNASDFEFTEDLLLSRNDQHNGESGQGSTVRRLNSLPPIPIKNNLRSARKRERSPSPVPVPVTDVAPKIVESSDHEVTSPSLDLPRKSVDYAHGTLDAYWNQIKSLDEKVKVISDCKESGGENCATLRSRRGRSCSIFPQARSTKITCDQTTDRVAPSSSDEVNDNEGTQERDREAVATPSCSVNVHDVFEVPQTSEKHKASEHGKRRLERWISDADNRLTKPDSVSEEIIESHVKHDMDKLKSMLNGNHEIKIPSPKDMKTIVWQRKEGVDVDCNAQAEFQKLHQRIDQLERETISVKKEILHEVNGEEHLRLLKDIFSQLKLMQSEMRSWKTQKNPPKRDIPLDPLQEAMVYFWI
ncbi:Myosin-binding protein 7 [Spatholobus suberectus]|nr:Myosin-binding protein 7 [Spatholobus suberectus]